MVVKIEMETKYQLLNKPKKVVKIKLKLKYYLSKQKSKDSIFRDRIESEEGLNQSPSATIKTRL